MPQILGMVVVFFYGICIGSFINVCVWRIPRHESIVYPGSYCPFCKHNLKVRDLFPLFSYLFLKAKCRYCHTGISLRYPLVELLTGFLFILVYLKYQMLTWQMIYYMALTILLLVAALIDLKWRIIPDVITLPGIILGFGIAWLFQGKFPVENFSGMLVGGGFLYLVAVSSLYFLRKEGMGGGDIKLLAMLGAFTGWQEVMVIIFLASFLGSLAGILLFLWKKLSSERILPFGPYLAIAGFIVVVWGQEILLWLSRFYSGRV